MNKLLVAIVIIGSIISVNAKTVTKQCPDCKGIKYTVVEETCPACKGKGFLYEGESPSSKNMLPCRRCAGPMAGTKEAGRGVIKVKKPCLTCDAKGKITVEQEDKKPSITTIYITKQQAKDLAKGKSVRSDDYKIVVEK